MILVLKLSSDLEAAIEEVANDQGVTAQELAIKTLQDRFLPPRITPRDEWERSLLEAGSDCGVSLSNEAVSSDGLYD